MDVIVFIVLAVIGIAIASTIEAVSDLIGMIVLIAVFWRLVTWGLQSIGGG